MNSATERLSEEEKQALYTRSRFSFDATVAHRAEVAAQNPSLASNLSQETHPQSSCGFGSSEKVYGSFCAKMLCINGNNFISVSSTNAIIESEAGYKQIVRFGGVIVGPIGAEIDLDYVYLAGVLNDVQSVVGQPLDFILEVTPYAVSIRFSDFGKFVGNLYSPDGHYGDEYYHGSGKGSFEIF